MDLKGIMHKPNGARYYRCALQVNTFDYVTRHNHQTAYKDEQSYNDAIIASCKANNIEIIGLGDHYRIHSAVTLIEVARKAGIIVFPGFEAVSKEGVHFLCLFDPSFALDGVKARIHACGVHDESGPSPLGSLDAAELLDAATGWPAQVVAAHIWSVGGLFKALQAGQARSAIWRHEKLKACGIAGAVLAAPEQLRPILENKNPDYQRPHAMAVLNCNDVCDPQDLAKPGTSCFIKMTSPTLEGLRQAFLDPDSRVRLTTDPAPEEHVEFIGMEWETEGFLRRCCLHFSENMNVLIGGRGSGKSSVIESLRYVLGVTPIGEDAKRIHDVIVKDVLQSGTKVSLAVQSYRPDRRLYVIERTVPGLPRVIDENGNVLSVKPLDVVRGVAVLGQNELAELARNPDKLTELLKRFIPTDNAQDEKVEAVREALRKNRTSILETQAAITKDTEAMASLPAVEEELKRYREAGVEAKLATQNQIVKAEAIVRTAREVVGPFSGYADIVTRESSIDQAFLSDGELEGLPVRDDLTSLRAVLAEFMAAAQSSAEGLKQDIAAAKTKIDVVAAKVEDARAASQADYEKTLRELQKERIDGAEFIRLRQDITRLAPLKDKLAKSDEKLEGLLQERRNSLAQWDELKRERFQKLDRAAKKVSRELPGRLRVTVAFGGNRAPLVDFLKEKPGGRLSETIAALTSIDDLSLSELAETCRQGADALLARYKIPKSQADRIFQAGSEMTMLVEELELPHTTEIELNVGPESAPPQWRKLTQLSTGQKATALLYLLLLDAEGPLVLDQPEDNLDNRFISEGVVPRIREEKRRRQFIFSTHNANIPVLGDAELIVAMQATGEAGDGHAIIPEEHTGAIDAKPVAVLVGEILEGGKDAFQTRRAKYGY